MAKGAYIGLAERRALYIAGSDVRNLSANTVAGGVVEFADIAVVPVTGLLDGLGVGDRPARLLFVHAHPDDETLATGVAHRPPRRARGRGARAHLHPR